MPVHQTGANAQFTTNGNYNDVAGNQTNYDTRNTTHDYGDTNNNNGTIYGGSVGGRGNTNTANVNRPVQTASDKRQGDTLPTSTRDGSELMKYAEEIDDLDKKIAEAEARVKAKQAKKDEREKKAARLAALEKQEAELGEDND